MARFGLRIGVRGPVLVAGAHGHLAVDTQPDLEPNSSNDRVKKGLEELLTLSLNMTLKSLSILVLTQRSWFKMKF